MSHITKYSLIAALTFVGAHLASADDSQLRDRLRVQRAQDEAMNQSSTVAVYAGDRGFSRAGIAEDRTSEPTVHCRPTGHGQAIPLFRSDEER